MSRDCQSDVLATNGGSANSLTGKDLIGRHYNRSGKWAAVNIFIKEAIALEELGTGIQIRELEVDKQREA